MALDGIVLHYMVGELKEKLIGSQILKINQPEKEELNIILRQNRQQYRLLLSADAGMPRLYLTDEAKENPATPSAYVMLLRKYLQNGKIIDITQAGTERIIQFHISHYNEMGDLSEKRLIIEIMGRHSNIILIDEHDKILESIKRIGANISSVREVYPGKSYVLPPAQNKISPLDINSFDNFTQILAKADGHSLLDKVMKSLTGVSPLLADWLCQAAGYDGSLLFETLTDADLNNIYQKLRQLNTEITGQTGRPYIIINADGQYRDFHTCLCLRPNGNFQESESLSALLDTFYVTKSKQTRLHQRSADLRKLLQNLTERCAKKLDLQEQQLKDTKNMDKFQIKGELLMAYQYQLPEKAEKVTVFNYYTDKEQELTLDPAKTVQENAKLCFEKYNKKKRTQIAVSQQLEKTKLEMAHLESIAYAVESAENFEDFQAIRKELQDAGYIKKSGIKLIHGKKMPKKQKNIGLPPYHYVSDEGFHFYVGRNNEQNEELALRFANNNDWWFHVKGIPGSHVIVKLTGTELSDRGFEQAAALAAYYSKGREHKKVEVDYTKVKELNKPNGSPLGYVIYHQNYSMVISPGLEGLTRID
ncbi:fibronectin/fibrinogen-binding protein [Clostridiales bacterium COT073_COT-073]|nr:fibronectin/fibrinogen-binding protein [Clostridiales bacterium COT073_COT-073]